MASACASLVPLIEAVAQNFALLRQAVGMKRLGDEEEEARMRNAEQKGSGRAHLDFRRLSRNAQRQRLGSTTDH
jgi:hypothetical protein